MSIGHRPISFGLGKLQRERWVTGLFWALCSTATCAQCADPCGPNLINNPSFEETTSFCSVADAQLYLDQSPVQGWVGTEDVIGGAYGSPDYFNSSCSALSTTNCGSGVASVGFYTIAVGSGINAREYIQSQLLAPLEAGVAYCFSAEVRGGSGFSPNDGLGIWFTDQPVNTDLQNGGAMFFGPSSPINAQPYWQLASGDVISSCTTRSGTFCATGNETWIVLGNFRNDAMTSVSGSPVGYLIVDNLVLTKTCPVTAPLEITASSTQLSCGATATLSAAGGGGAYTWTPNIGSGPGPFTVSPASPMTYTVSSTVAGSCGSQIETAEITIDVETCAHTISVTAGETCAGGCIDLVATLENADHPPYTVTWSNGVADGLGPHNVCPSTTTTYTVTATDVNGSVAMAQVTAVVYPSPVLSTSSVNASCFGLSDGAASVVASGGSPPYSHSWSTLPVQVGATSTGIPAGSYTVTTTDANGCMGVATVDIDQPEPLTVALSVTPAICGLQNGSVTAIPSGGVGPYWYSWSTTPAQNTATITGLGSGDYTVVVTDAGGCSALVTGQVISSGAVQLAVDHIDVSCNGASDGTATVSVTNGTAPFTYLWNTLPEQATATASGLVAGTWAATVTDSNGCVGVVSVTVAQPAAIVVEVSTAPAYCGLPNGSATVDVNGGMGPYVILWNTTPPQATPTASGLSPGNHMVEVTDLAGCAASVTAMVEGLAGPTAGFSVSDGCSGSPVSFTNTSEGAIQWLWDMGDGAFYSLAEVQHTYTNSGTFAVTLTAIDVLGCEDSFSSTVTIAPVPAVEFTSSTLVGCMPLESIFVNTTPLPGASCLWQFSDGGTSTDCAAVNHTFVGAGCFDVTLTISASGCTGQHTESQMVCVSPLPHADFLVLPDPISVTDPVAIFQDLSLGASDIFWSFEGGVPNSFTIEHPTVDYTGQEPGNYQACLEVVNASGCVDSVCRILTIVDELRVYVPNGFTPNGDGINDVFIPVLLGFGKDRYELLVFNRWGEVIFETNEPTKGWDGILSGRLVQEGAYVWKLKVSADVGGRFREFVGHVTLLR